MTLILAMIGFSNLLLSITIISVLRVSQGMESLEIISNENLVKFYGKTDLDRVKTILLLLLIIIIIINNNYLFNNKGLH